MSVHKALYRKWRPRNFSDIAGQKHVTETLRNQVQSGRLSHAYLFVGSRGTGKTTCAKVLSRALNCRQTQDGNPCNECLSCKGIENGSILDVLEIDAASNSGVDNVRALREEAAYTPATTAKRVYIIDEVHMLSVSAFNALLILLEEPPEHLVFILATTELHKVPATILSRCQRFAFKRIPKEVITTRLEFVADSEGISMTKDAAQKIAALADGSMRDGLSLLDQCFTMDSTIDLKRVQNTLGLAGHDDILTLMEAISNEDVTNALGIVDDLYSDGKDMAALLGDLLALVRELLIYKLSPDSPLLRLGFTDTELCSLADELPQERLFYFLDSAKDSMRDFTRSGGQKLATEMCIIRMCKETNQPTVRTKTDQQPTKRQKPENLPKVGGDQQMSSENNCQPSTVNCQPSSSWQGVLEELRGDMPVYTLLSDESKVKVQIQDSTLIIRAASPFVIHTIESKTFSQALKDAAQKILGHPIALRVEADETGNSDGGSALDKLHEFDIIKFE